MKKTSKWEALAEWCLLALMIAVVMDMGAMRVHQLKLNLFLGGSYAAIAVLMSGYRLIYRKWFAKDEPDEAGDKEE